MEFILALVGTLFATWYIGAVAVVVALWLIIGTAFDRSRNTSASMWLGVVAVVVFSGIMLGLPAALELVSSATFWKNVALYLAIGFAYSWVVEFFFAVRRSSRYYADKWSELIKDNKKLRHYLADPATTDTEVVQSAKDSVERFIQYNRSSSRIITIEATKNGVGVIPKTNRRALVDNITAWTLLWPAYAISLIVGDLFTQLVETVVDMTSKLSTKFVQWAFRDTFKV